MCLCPPLCGYICVCVLINSLTGGKHPRIHTHTHGSAKCPQLNNTKNAWESFHGRCCHCHWHCHCYSFCLIFVLRSLPGPGASQKCCFIAVPLNLQVFGHYPASKNKANFPRDISRRGRDQGKVSVAMPLRGYMGQGPCTPQSAVWPQLPVLTGPIV